MRRLLSVPLGKILHILSALTGTLQTAPLIVENWPFDIITTLENKILLLIVTISNLFKEGKPSKNSNNFKLLHTA